jgi:hypothetical protein
MLANGQPPAEIRERLDVSVDVIREALDGWHAEACPLQLMPDAAIERLIEDDIGGFMRLTMVRVSPEARREFSDQLLAELASVPYSLLHAAMAEARRKISYPERLVPFVFDFVETRSAKLASEGERLSALLEIANG